MPRHATPRHATPRHPSRRLRRPVYFVAHTILIFALDPLHIKCDLGIIIVPIVLFFVVITTIAVKIYDLARNTERDATQLRIMRDQGMLLTVRPAIRRFSAPRSTLRTLPLEGGRQLLPGFLLRGELSRYG